MKKVVAIYSRKSKFTGKGDSIENQVEMCKEYIHKNFGTDIEFKIYEDEGFSGGTLDRPRFKKLMNDVQNKKIDILVCYRLDRISRNVADFSSTLELLQSNNCDFISIREQFDTSSPMGRAMIYIASVFAQLERETIAERVKDNMLEMAKNGRWTGGKIPLGFTSKKIVTTDESGLTREMPQLIIDENEMNIVKLLYEKYVELGSLHKLECYATENQIKSRTGIMFEKSTLKIILQNPIYVKANYEVIEYLSNNSWTVYGEPDNVHSLLTYNKTEQSKKNGKITKVNKPVDERIAALSSIKGFIEPELWLSVQKQFEENKDKFPRLGKTNNALLVGKLKCGKCGEYMLVQHGRVSKNGEKLFYYNCSLKRKSHKTLCDNGNAKASHVENLVLLTLKQIGLKKDEFLREFEKQHNASPKNKDIKLEKLSLEKALQTKKGQIDNLVTTLSLAEDISSILIEKIQKLKLECVEIQNKIDNIELTVATSKVEMFNYQIIEQLLDQCANIENLSRDEQKIIIDGLIDEIYWFGNGRGDGDIKIKIVGSNDDGNIIEFNDDELGHAMLQNSSHSMSSI
ncbi:recombinase family protein [Clostridium beijerinckii]|uniref:Recombinase family protein n=1 Tax=Clostridium beijerinckii TaxID=1520 RepID=A0A7X9SMA9_CLOBE|nr:recombinase family protein [Clostridium beijerinckii]NMF04522.1 recombinase family protein [Clostridium beijerinckii]